MEKKLEILSSIFSNVDGVKFDLEDGVIRSNVVTIYPNQMRCLCVSNIICYVFNSCFCFV